MADKRSIPDSIDIPIFQGFEGKDVNLLGDVIFSSRVKLPRMLKHIGITNILVHFAKSQLLITQDVQNMSFGVIRTHITSWESSIQNFMKRKGPKYHPISFK